MEIFDWLSMAGAASSAGLFITVLLRVPRHQILFLRRFDHQPAVDALVAALSHRQGIDQLPSRFRFITLQDGIVAMQGVPRRSPRLTIGGAVVAAGGLAVVGRQMLVARAKGFGDSGIGAFWMFMGAMVALLGLTVVFATILVNRRASSADVSGNMAVTSSAELDAAVDQISSSRGRFMTPRMRVIQTASPLWRAAVVRFAEISSVALVDVTDPSENLLWELEAIVVGQQVPCVLIRQETVYDENPVGGSSEPNDLVECRVEEILADRDVLPYRAGQLDRFARLIHDELCVAVGLESAT